MATHMRSFLPRGGWLVGCGILTVLLIASLPGVVAAQADADDAEVPPGVTQQQLRYDAHEEEAAPRRAPRTESKLRAPITLQARHVRIGTGYTFLGLGVFSVLVGTTVSIGSPYPWFGQIVGGSLGALFIFGIGLPVLIAGYARRHTPPSVALHVGPGHLQLVGHF